MREKIYFMYGVILFIAIFGSIYATWIDKNADSRRRKREEAEKENK
ncbi:MAG: hypothetical protein LBF08_07550 [Dysgonamonadaceae bacterium]|nr:hypothetical protein [Dysgonamonadaceae bacterium]